MLLLAAAFQSGHDAVELHPSTHSNILLLLQQSKAFKKAIAAYERAAAGQERLNSPWHSAKHLEKAAECCKELSQAADMPSW